MEALKRSEDTVVSIKDRIAFDSPASQGALEDELDGLLSFVVTAREKLRALRGDDFVSPEAALAVLSLMQQLLIRETKTFEFEGAIEDFESRLLVEPVYRSLLRRLYKSAHAVLQSARRNVHSTSGAAHLIAHLEELLLWYAKRKESLIRMNFNPNFHGEGKEGIFSTEVLHDCVRCGVRGLEVSLGLRTEGRGGEEFWAKVFVYLNGQALNPAEGWFLWVDETDFTGKEYVRSDAVFAAIAPVGISESRQIVDEVKLFVPYAALGLPESMWGRRAEFTLYGGIFDQKGERLFAFNRKESTRLPRKDSLEKPIPSPQACGLWGGATNFADAVSSVVISPAFLQGGQVEVLNITFDAFLADHGGETVSAEVRFISENGELVPSSAPGSMDRTGSFLAAISLRAEEPLFRCHDQLIQVPTSHLDLQSGVHDLFCELSLRQFDGRILAGGIERCRVRVWE